MISQIRSFSKDTKRVPDQSADLDMRSRSRSRSEEEAVSSPLQTETVKPLTMVASEIFGETGAPQMRVYNHNFHNNMVNDERFQSVSIPVFPPAMTRVIEIDPGFDWRNAVAPKLEGCPNWCMSQCVGFLVSGELGVQLANGSIKVINAGECYCIPPGHIKIVGLNKEKAVMIEFAVGGSATNTSFDGTLGAAEISSPKGIKPLPLSTEEPTKHRLSFVGDDHADSRF